MSKSMCHERSINDMTKEQFIQRVHEVRLHENICKEFQLGYTHNEGGYFFLSNTEFVTEEAEQTINDWFEEEADTDWYVESLNIRI